jgi:hypothetical protein
VSYEIPEESSNYSTDNESDYRARCEITYTQTKKTHENNKNNGGSLALSFWSRGMMRQRMMLFVPMMAAGHNYFF